MKIGILGPTTWQLVEKMASLFTDGVEIVGPLSDDAHYWNDYRRKIKEWEDLNLKVKINIIPYKDIDLSSYDLLIQSIETFSYSKDWYNHCHRIECPILLKACWTRDPCKIAPAEYIRKIKQFPVLLEMPAHAPIWKKRGFSDVNTILNPVGNWWFDKEWTGEQERILFVLSGTTDWRGKDRSLFGFEIWEKICKAFPGKTHHHDGHLHYKTSLEMADLFRQSRVFINLDKPYGQGERPLTLAFSEALSAGLPVVARDLPGLSYHQYIDSNGVCTNDFEALCSFIEKCLSDITFARQCSVRSREIALQSISSKVLKPEYEKLIHRARTAFEAKKTNPLRSFFQSFKLKRASSN